MAGTFPFSVVVTDTTGSSAQQSLSITIVSPGSPLLAVSTIVPTPLPNGQVNVPYLAVLTTAAPLTGAPTWTVTSGSLPPGLTLNAADGTISGTPTTAGTFAFSVVVTDTTGSSAQQSFFITIIPPPSTIIATGLPQGKEGTAYTTTLSVSGGTSPYNWSISSGSLPSGLTLGSTTGIISGTPSRGAAGTSNFTVNITNSSSPSLSAQMSFSIYIEKGTYQAVISIGSGLTAGSTKVFVDGTIAATLKGGESITLTFDLGTTKNVSVEPMVTNPTDAGVRFKATDESLVVSELKPSAGFTYYTEYLVNIKTEPSISIQPTGSGWYQKGTNLSSSSDNEVEGNPGTQYRFAYWLLPGDKQVTTQELNFTADSPTTITAKYDTYYKLTTESIYGQVEGGGWYKQGSHARWLVVKDKVPMPGIIGFFQGKYKAVNPSGTETMDGPKTVTVSWQPDYTMAIIVLVSILLFILVIVRIYVLWRRQHT